jgi:hypothetical protein
MLCCGFLVAILVSFHEPAIIFEQLAVIYALPRHVISINIMMNTQTNIIIITIIIVVVVIVIVIVIVISINIIMSTHTKIMITIIVIVIIELLLLRILLSLFLRFLRRVYGATMISSHGLVGRSFCLHVHLTTCLSRIIILPCSTLIFLDNRPTL